MWLVAGLGNPGVRYARTRHNIGFLALEGFAKRHRLVFKLKKDCKIIKGFVEDSEIVLMEPLTFMNRSGLAVRKIAGKFNIEPEKIIVIHDDIDMEAGRLKIRRRGSSGGHRGVESIIGNICSKNFIRIKIGIGRDISIPPEAYVLSKFKRHELPLIRESINKASDAVESIIAHGVDRAMNIFN